MWTPLYYENILMKMNFYLFIYLFIEIVVIYVVLSDACEKIHGGELIPTFNCR